jgi:hypothetical protein
MSSLRGVLAAQVACLAKWVLPRSRTNAWARSWGHSRFRQGRRLPRPGEESVKGRPRGNSAHRPRENSARDRPEANDRPETAPWSKGRNRSVRDPTNRTVPLTEFINKLSSYTWGSVVFFLDKFSPLVNFCVKKWKNERCLGVPDCQIPKKLIRKSRDFTWGSTS